MRKSLKNAGLAAASFSLTLGIMSVLADPAAASALTVTATSDEVRTKLVSVRGLDLSQPQDVRRLEQRIRSASRKVCDSGTGRLLPMQEQSCRQSAIDATRPQVARLVDRAQRLAAAGAPVETVASIAVAASE